MKSLSLVFYTVPLLASGLRIEPAELPEAIAGKPYNVGPIQVVGGGDCPRNFPVIRMVAGQLPDGVVLNSSGYFSGSPIEPGTYRIVLRVANDCVRQDQELWLRVAAAPLFFLDPPEVTVDLPFGAKPGRPIYVRVQGSAPGASYEIEQPPDGWAHVKSISHAIPRENAPLSSDLLEVHIDPAGLPPGVHRTAARLVSWRSGNSPILHVILRVAEPPLGAQAGSLPLVPIPQAKAAHGSPAGPIEALKTPKKAVAKKTAAKSETKPAAGMPTRLSRTGGRRFAASVPSRRSLAAMKQHPPAAAAAPDAHAPKAAAHAGPADHGKPADAHAKPAAAHGKPADAHGKPADGHGKPAEAHGKADAHAKPDAHAKADAHGKPAAAHGKPADGHGKPAASHGKPAEAHGKSDAHAKPTDHGKPAASHGKPADGHGKAGAGKADAHAKPADAHGKPAAGPAKPAEHAKAAPAKDGHGASKH